MLLYHFPLSPNCQKVAALSYELGSTLEIAPVDLFRGESRTPEFLRLNPNGRVPVLRDGDFVLSESNAILGYLANRAGRHDLAPTTARERAQVDQWLSWYAAHFGAAIRKVAFERVVKRLAGLGPADDAQVAAGSREFAESAAVLEAALKSREHVLGPLTIVDFALCPGVALADTCGLALTPFPHVGAWLARMKARPSVARALSEAALYGAARQAVATP